MVRFTIDVIASCAFGINSNSLKNPDEEFGRPLRKVTDPSVKTGLAMLTAFFAPHHQTIFRLKILEGETNNHLKQIAWNTVEYR